LNFDYYQNNMVTGKSWQRQETNEQRMQGISAIKPFDHKKIVT